MLITCPSCGTSYDVPDALVRDGRNVRCARCRTQWSVTARSDTSATHASGPAPARPAPLLMPVEAFGLAEEDEELPVPSRMGQLPADPDFGFDPEPPPAPLREARPAREPAARQAAETEDRGDRATRLLVGLGWLGTVAVLAGLVWAGYHFRADIMQAWPASERLYAALGWRVTQ